MERLPSSLLVDIAIQLASITDDDNGDFDAITGIRNPKTAPSPLRCLSKGRLSSLNAFSRSSRRCHLACNPVLYETAVALDLVRFLVRKPYDHEKPVADRTDHSYNLAASPEAAKDDVSFSQRIFPPFEATELSLEHLNSASSRTYLPNSTSTTAPRAWLRQGAIVVAAAASGNISLLERLMLHFPGPRVRSRVLPTNVNELLVPPDCSNGSIFYLRHSYYLPLPCASHFHWSRSPCDAGIKQETNALPQHEIECQSDVPLAAASASPLHAAACEGQDATVAWLLDRHANIEDLALHCCQCQSPHMRFLLEHSLPRDPAYEGALPTVSTESCLRFYEAPAATPLSLALAYGRQSTARLLILRGAVWDRPAPMSYGVSPLHIMAAAGMVDLLRWITTREFKFEPNCATPTSALRHHDWPDYQGLHALHYAAVAGSRGLDIGDHAPITILTETQAQDLVDALLRLGSVTSPSFEHVGRLVASEARRVDRNTSKFKAMRSDDNHSCSHLRKLALRDSLHRRVSWFSQLFSWLDDLDPELMGECPVAFAERLGSDAFATALSRRLVG